MILVYFNPLKKPADYKPAGFRAFTLQGYSSDCSVMHGIGIGIVFGIGIGICIGIGNYIMPLIGTYTTDIINKIKNFENDTPLKSCNPMTLCNRTIL
jgi:hypothetical protein